MLPDRKLGSARPSASTWIAPADRRHGSDRVEVNAEAVVVWSHAPGVPVRYRALDISPGGMRVRSTLPLREGMIGTLLSLLPGGAAPNQAFQVVWCKRCNDESGALSGYEAGLRFQR
jgi:hypothetical protein